MLFDLFSIICIFDLYVLLNINDRFLVIIKQFIMRHLSAGLLIVLLVIPTSCKFFKDRGIFGKKQKTLFELRAEQDSIRVADSIKKVKEHLIAIEDAKIDSLKKADEVKLTMESKYNISVGSFITPEYAIVLAEVYRKQGYDAQILKMSESKFELVAAEGHKSFRKAVMRLNAFRDTVQIDAWLYVRK